MSPKAYAIRGRMHLLTFAGEPEGVARCLVCDGRFNRFDVLAITSVAPCAGRPTSTPTCSLCLMSLKVGCIGCGGLVCLYCDYCHGCGELACLECREGLKAPGRKRCPHTSGAEAVSAG